MNALPRLIAAAVLVVAAALAWPGQAPGQAARQAAVPPLLRERQIGGSATSVVVKGTLAYLAEGPWVAVVDLAQPGAPKRVGESPALPGVVRDLAWSGERLVAIYRDAMAGEGNDGLALLDLADPRKPTLSASLTLPAGPISLAGAGGRFFVAGHDPRRGQALAGHESLQPVDGAGDGTLRPGRPLVLNESGQVLPAARPLHALSAGGRIWVVRRADVAGVAGTEARAYDPAAVPDGAPLARVAVEGEHQAAAFHPSLPVLLLVMVEPVLGRVTLRALDLVAEAPELGEVELEARRGCGGPLALRGATAAYVDRCARRLQLIDLTAPATPRLLGSLALDVAAEDLAWDGDRLVVAGGAMGGLRVVSAADPAAPSLVGALTGLGAVSHLAARQAPGERTVIYASDPVAGLRALDLRAAVDRAGGMLLGDRIDVTRAGALAVAGRQLVVGGASVLRPFDLATPGSPRPLPTVPVGQVAETMATDGERFYAGFGDLGLAALEGGPGDLHETARLEQPLVWRVDRTADGTGLIGQGLGALHELDGETLQVRRSWPLPGQPDFRVNRADSLAVDGDLVHLAVASYTHTGVANSFNDRLMSLRPGAAGAIAEPAGRVDGIIGTRAGRVLARDGVVLVAGDRQVTVLGMAPSGPLKLGEWASPGSGSDLLWLPFESDSGIAIDGIDLVFVADGEAGLAILTLEQSPQLPSPTPTATATRTATPRGTRPTPTPDRRVLLPHLSRQATARPTARR